MPFEFAEQWRQTSQDSHSCWITNRGQVTLPWQMGIDTVTASAILLPGRD